MNLAFGGRDDICIRQLAAVTRHVNDYAARARLPRTA